MGLRVWNLLTDPYDHDQLADNWAKVDFHDHTPGRGTQIPTEGLFNGAVTTAKIADGGVTIAKTASDATGLAAGAFRAHSNVQSNLTTGSVIPFGAEDFDISSWYDPSTSRYIPQTKGIYQLMATCMLNTTMASPKWAQLEIRRNGARMAMGQLSIDASIGLTVTANELAVANGTTDYFEVALNHSNGSAVQLAATGYERTFFAGRLVGKVS